MRLGNLAIFAMFGAVLLCLPWSVDAVGPTLLEQLRQGGLIVYLRHTKTDLSQSDGPNFDIDNCASQRNLTQEGRDQAREIGLAIERLQIPVTQVWSSPFCRAKETAELAFKSYEVSDYLHFSIGLEKDQREKIAEKLRKRLMTKVDEGGNVVLVSHSGNLREAASVWPKPEGVAYVFRPLGDRFEVLGKILPHEWTTLE